MINNNTLNADCSTSVNMDICDKPINKKAVKASGSKGKITTKSRTKSKPANVAMESDHIITTDSNSLALDNTPHNTDGASEITANFSTASSKTMLNQIRTNKPEFF